MMIFFGIFLILVALLLTLLGIATISETITDITGGLFEWGFNILGLLLGALILGVSGLVWWGAVAVLGG